MTIFMVFLAEEPKEYKTLLAKFQDNSSVSYVSLEPSSLGAAAEVAQYIDINVQTRGGSCGSPQKNTQKTQSLTFFLPRAKKL